MGVYKDKRTAENLRKDPAKHAAYLERKRRNRADRQRQCGAETNRKRKWRATNPEAARRIRQANHAVETALNNGSLVRPETCSKCGATGTIQGHHWSYSPEHWLDVIWLCVGCHAKEHF